MKAAFCANSGNKLIMAARFPVLFFVVAALLLTPVASGARSAHSPRHSGLEPPGGPKKLDMLPGGAANHSLDGGLGYVDAYGNPLMEREKAKKPRRARPRPGAYGGYGEKEKSRPLPDPDAAPVWNYR